MTEFWGEVIGTALLLTLGNGIVANQLLGKTKGNGTGWLLITVGWGLSVAVAAYSVARISGAHLNPAVTIGVWYNGGMDLEQVPVYLAAQMLGAFIGAVLVWLTYYSHWSETDDADLKLAVFSTGPAIRAPFWNLFCEVVGTAVLIFGILAIAANVDEMKSDGLPDFSTVFSSGINPLLVGLLVCVIGMGLGGPTGFAINPARDLAPRIAHAILPIPGKGTSDWGYAWIPVVGPMLGGVLGAMLFQVLGS
ncbi:MAG: MIP/aquaporin family protein [Pirellulaceae bacterium]